MKAKAKISGMLTKFHVVKCKTSLKLVVSRIKLLKNKRETQIRQMRRELAQLLETGQDQTAIIRVEHVIREEKTISAYDLIEVYCELIAARLPIIESQKLCPIDLKEAISSVIFAGPRCADLTELVEIRKQFTAKYGREFITAAIEVRPDCGVSRLIVEKLSARAPDAETKMKVLAEVAKEHNIEWEPKAFEEKMHGTKDDLLDGPTSFTSAGNVRMESSGFSPLPSHYSNNDSNLNMPKNNATTDKRNFMFSNMNAKGPSSAVHSGASEKVDNEVKDSYSRQENGSSNHSNWNMEFKDAASAAQAAAVSAERASMAARAAAELASRGSMSGQHSSESYESPTYVSSPKLESAPVLGSTNLQVDSRRGSMLRQHSAESPESASHASRSKLEESTPVLGSMNVQVDSRRVMHDPKQRIENVQRDSGVQSSANLVAKSLSRKDSDTSSVASAKSYSSGPVKSVTTDVVHQEPDANSYVHRQGSSSSSQSASKLFRDESDEEEDEVLHKLDISNVQPAYSAFPINYDDYSWDDHENTRKVDSSDVVFDSYESDNDAKNIFNTFDMENTHYTSMQQKQTQTLFSDVSSPRQQKSGSLFMESSSHTNPAKGNYYMDYEEAIPKADFHSPSDDNFQPTYDSDDHESGNDDEIEKLEQTEATKENTFLYKESSSKHELWNSSTSFDEKKAVEEDKPSARSSVRPDDEMKLEKRWRKPGMSVRNYQSGISMRSNQPTPRKASSSRDDESERDLIDNGPSPSVSNEEDEFSGSLHLGLLRGGLKHKNYRLPSYVTDPIIDYSNDKQIPSGTSESFTSPRVKRGESSSEDSMSKVSASKSRASKFYSADEVEDQTPPRSSINPLSTFKVLSVSSDSDEEEQPPVIRVAERGNKNPPLSWKTKVVPSDARKDTRSRAAGSSVGVTSLQKEYKSPSEATERNESRGSDDMSNSSHYQAELEKPDKESSSVSSKPVQNETRQPATSDNDGSSIGNAISSENSQKNPSHVHHKLPDYDTLHSYFSSLRSNVRPN